MSDSANALIGLGLPTTFGKTTHQLGGRRVFANGTILSRGDETISLYPFANPLEYYLIELAFVDNQLMPSAVNTHILDGYIRISFQNMRNPFGQSNARPIHVANYVGRIALMDVAYYLIGNDSEAVRIVHYTISDGGPVSF